MVIEGVVAEVHQARDLNRHFDVKSDHFGPGHDYDDHDGGHDDGYDGHDDQALDLKCYFDVKSDHL